VPQETPSHPDAAQASLEGWIPPLASDAAIRDALEKAFDYRGDVTLTLKDGQHIEGYIFDRQSTGPALADCFIRVFPRDSDQKQSIRYSAIAAITFSGRDTAAGKSFQAWIKQYWQTKRAAAGAAGQ